jgi:NAD(P)-dependent dehydrogenase (short-subunit alcohol dehydrogenase family)
MQTVVITGGASGLGKALAQRYVTRGYRVVVADIDDEAGQAVVDALNQEGKALYCHCDVSSAKDFERLAHFAREHCGGCHILVNNAGIASSGTLMEVDDAEWQRLLDVNLMSCVYGSRAFIPLLKESASEKRPGAIVNVASLAALGLLGGMITYNVSKAAVVAFSESLRCELINDHIHVAAACPSFFKTNLTASMTTSPKETIERVERWMEKSELSAESVARDIMQGIEDKELVILPDKKVRKLYRLYRFIYQLLMPKAKSKVN